MSMFQIFNVAGSAVSAQSQRLNVVASNLANADTVAGPDGSAYKARQVVFQTELMGAQGAAGVREVGRDDVEPLALRADRAAGDVEDVQHRHGYAFLTVRRGSRRASCARRR